MPELVHAAPTVRCPALLETHETSHSIGRTERLDYLFVARDYPRRLHWPVKSGNRIEIVDALNPECTFAGWTGVYSSDLWPVLLLSG